MENRELISVIVPIYNVEKYLKRCIDSIIEQTYTNLEIILVDDESPDNCGKICDEYAKKDKRIIVIHKKNGGLSDARNRGLQEAKGKYVGFVDSDDYISKNMYKVLYTNMKENNADISICNFSLVDDNGIEYKNKKQINNEIKLYGKMEAMENLLIEKDYTNHAWNKLYNKKLFEDGKIQYPKGKIWEDIATTYLLFENANKVVYQNISLYYYVQRDNSIMKEINKEKIILLGDIINQRNYYLSKKYNTLQKAIEINEGKYIKYYYDMIFMSEYSDLYKDKLYKKYYKRYREVYLKNKKEIQDTQVTRTGKIGCSILYYSRTMYKFYTVIKKIIKRG